MGVSFTQHHQFEGGSAGSLLYRCLGDALRQTDLCTTERLLEACSTCNAEGLTPITPLWQGQKMGPLSLASRRVRGFPQAAEQAVLLLLCLDPGDLGSFDSFCKSYLILCDIFHKVLLGTESGMSYLSLKLT